MLRTHPNSRFSMKLSVCVLTLLLSLTASAQVDFGGGFLTDDDLSELSGRFTVEQLLAQQEAQEQQQAERTVSRRYPYGQHDRMMITMALKEYYGENVSGIRFPGQWHFMNTFAYLQPIGNFMMSSKHWLNDSWIMKRWRKMTGDQTAFISTKTDRYMGSYAVTFVTPEKSMACNAYIIEQNRQSLNEPQKFKISIAGCNSGWRFVDENELFQLILTAP